MTASRLTLAYLSALSLLITLPEIGAAAPISHVIGGHRIEISEPVGYVDGLSASQEFIEFARSAAVPSNRLLAFFVDSNEASKSPGVGLTSFFIASTSKEPALQAMVLSSADFGQLKEMFKEKQKQNPVTLPPNASEIVENANNNIQTKRGDSRAVLKLGDQTTLGVFHEEEAAVSFVTSRKISVVLDGISRETGMVVGESVILAKGHVVFLYAFRTYRSPSDVEWAKTAVRGWAQDIIQINNRPTRRSSGPSASGASRHSQPSADLAR